MKKLSKGEIIFYAIILFSLVMVNPPVLMLINRFAIETPLIFRLPTLWIWLQFWYVLMIAAFLLSAIRVRRWRCYQDEKPIEPEERGDRQV
jgi:hypothetical protein